MHVYHFQLYLFKSAFKAIFHKTFTFFYTFSSIVSLIQKILTDLQSALHDRSHISMTSMYIFRWLISPSLPLSTPFHTDFQIK